MSSGDAPALAIDDLSVVLHRAGVAAEVLAGVSLTVARGEIVALVGRSGSGKSTIGLAAAGLLPASAAPRLTGSIRVAGHQVVGMSTSDRRTLLRNHVGIVFQDPMTTLNPTMRIATQLAEAIDDGTTPAQWLARVGFADPARAVASYPMALSGGQRQRVLIAMAMARRPALVIADEPTTALDVTVQAEILRQLEELCREQRAGALFVTHDLAVAATLADRVVVLYAGRVVEDGPAARVIERPAHPYTAMLLAARFGLDADKSRPLMVPPDPTTAAGDAIPCRFAQRCPLARPDCPDIAPADVASGGASACVRPFDVSSDLWPAQTTPWPQSVTAPATPLLSMAGVGKTFFRQGSTWGARRPGFQALRGINLEVGVGEAIAVVGESGSGKSTLLRIAAGLVAPDAGTLTRADPADRPQIVFQDAAASLTPWLSIGEQIAERLRPHRHSAPERQRLMLEALDLVGLPTALASAKPSALSGGQCQRAAIARAIVRPPRLLLCDEAVSAMDVSLAAAILNLIGRVRRRLGMALLFVTHDLAAARVVADRIVVLKDGQVVEDGPADALVVTPKASYTRALLAAMPENLARDRAA